MSLKYNFGGIEGAASAVQGSVGDASAATSDRQLQSFVVQFDRPVDPVLSEDVFDFKAIEESEGVGKPNPGKLNFEHYFDTSSAFDGDGMDDLATYQPDASVIELGQAYTFTIDPREVGATMAEYCVMIA
jgi:hypothetical protein